jgi:hypothetical protein
VPRWSLPHARSHELRQDIQPELRRGEWAIWSPPKRSRFLRWLVGALCIMGTCWRGFRLLPLSWTARMRCPVLREEPFVRCLDLWILFGVGREWPPEGVDQLILFFQSLISIITIKINTLQLKQYATTHRKEQTFGWHIF